MKPNYALLTNLYQNNKNSLIRNPVYRAVEFYVSQVLDPNQIIFNSDNESFINFCKEVFQTSNFSQNNPKYLRELALLGNLFLKVIKTKDKIYFISIPQENITALEEDSRGYITEIEFFVSNADNTYSIERWSKSEQYAYFYYNRLNQKSDENPDAYIQLSQIGIDFIPIVHIKFKETDSLYATGCVSSVIPKIVEANKLAARLHELQFKHNSPIWKRISNAVTKDGSKNAKVVKFSDETIINLSEGEDFSPTVPNINYADALNILKAMEHEIEKDLPELRYFEISDTAASGKAIKLLFQAAMDKAKEVRVNYLFGLIRILQICATIAQFTGLSEYLGKYPDGLKLSLEVHEDDLVDVLEKFEILGKAINNNINPEIIMKALGFNQEQIASQVTYMNLQNNSILSILKDE